MYHSISDYKSVYESWGLPTEETFYCVEIIFLSIALFDFVNPLHSVVRPQQLYASWNIGRLHHNIRWNIGPRPYHPMWNIEPQPRHAS